jgi:WD40 repeat protein
MPPHRPALPIILLLLCAGSAAAQRTDRLGDPLPPGAIARIGTTRLQLDREIQALAVAPDGKRIAAISDSMLGVWDLPSGKQLLNRRWPQSQDYVWRVVGFAADGKLLLCSTSKVPQLAVLDIATGKMGPPLGDGFARWRVARDGRMALRAVPHDMTVAFTIEPIDLPSGRRRSSWTFHYDPAFFQAMRPLGVEFHLSPDGKLLAAHEQLDGARKELVRVFDTANGGEMARWPIDSARLRGITFSDDGKLLAATADGTRDAAACVWEIATGKELSRWPLKSGISTGRFGVAFAHDGDSLFVTDATGIVRWDWRHAKRLQDYPDAGGPIAMLNGGKTMAVQGPIGAIRLLDVASGKDLCPLPRAGDHVALAPDSRHLAWSEGGTIVLADGAGNELRRWAGHERFVGPLVFAPDGKTLASAGTDMRIRLWDIPEGRERRTMIRAGVQRLSFSRDGRRLVTSGGWDVCLWDVASGKRLGFWYGRGEPPVMAPSLDVIAVPDRQAGRLRLIEPAGGQEVYTLTGYCGMVAYLGQPHVPFAPLFSPDSRLLMAGRAGTDPDYDFLATYEVASGERLPPVLNGEHMILGHAAFSPDSRLLAVMRTDGRLMLRDAATGATARLLGQAAEPWTVGPLFTPDGRTLVTAIKESVHLWEVASGGQIVCRGNHQDAVRGLTLSGDGRLLASGSADRTTLVWDLAHLAPAGAAPPDALWADLATADAARGRRAIEALIAAPVQAVALLQKRLPAIEPNSKQVARWLAELGSDDFEQRQRAERGLGNLGELAGPALRRALVARPAAEPRRRIADLLKKLDGSVLGPQQLRAVRGVQVLEALGSAEARQLLETLAKGPAVARVTIEARAALSRFPSRDRQGAGRAHPAP